jgi:hypothetical protein
MKVTIDAHVYADLKGTDGAVHNNFVGSAAIECEDMGEYSKGVNLVKEIFYSGLKEQIAGDKEKIVILPHTK